MGRPIAGATSTTYTPSNISIGFNYYDAVVTQGCSITTQTLNITVSKASVAGVISGPTTICRNATTGRTLTLSGHVGSIQWQSASTLTGAYTNIVGATSATFNAVTTTVGTTYYKAVLKSGTCTASTTDAFGVTITSCLTKQLIVNKPIKTIFDVIATPNPFTSNFNLNVTTSSSDRVEVKVYDMIGKLIETHNIEVSEIANQELGNNYASGVYNVIVTQGTEVKTLRMIKR
jgi:hypothetical protein